MRIKGINKAKFKKALLNKTGCNIQHNGWTCGTCFFGISKTLNNRHWRALLFYRGDYTLEDLNESSKTLSCCAKDITLEEVEIKIKEIWELIK